MKWRWGWEAVIEGKARRADSRFYGFTHRRVFIGVYIIDRSTFRMTRKATR